MKIAYVTRKERIQELERLRNKEISYFNSQIGFEIMKPFAMACIPMIYKYGNELIELRKGI